MKGVILRKGERAYSYFSGVLSAIFPAVVERNWLITGYENYPEALEPYGGNLGREAFFWAGGAAGGDCPAAGLSVVLGRPVGI